MRMRMKRMGWFSGSGGGRLHADGGDLPGCGGLRRRHRGEDEGHLPWLWVESGTLRGLSHN